MAINTTLQEEIAAAAPGRVRFGEPMERHTTFHLGGAAEIWAEPQDEQELGRLLRVAREAELPLTIVGGGANLLVRDGGIPGLVIRLGGRAFQDCRREGNRLIASAALPLEWLIRRAQEEGLSGVEFLAGVPGRVGGAVRMNAGTHDDRGALHSMADIVRSVRVMDRQGGMRQVPAGDLEFGYRSARLDGQIVLEAELELVPDDPSAIVARIRRLWDYKKRTQDWSAPSVGCIFKNPSADVIPAEAGIVPSAGWLIDQAGLKGRRIGGAMISHTHANFILNVENARAADVLALIEEARGAVRSRFGLELELEVKILP